MRGTLTPTFVLLISTFYLKQHINRKQWLALLISYVGIVLVFLHDLKGGAPNIALQLLLYPATDATTETPSRRALAEGYLLEKKSIDWFFAQYVPAGIDPEGFDGAKGCRWRCISRCAPSGELASRRRA